jgi:alpha-ribazole phosphatase
VNEPVTHWWWIRHAPVEGDGGIIYGHSDVAALPPDERTRAAIAAALPRDPVWITSPLRRASDTLDRLRGTQGTEQAAAIFEPDFAEQNFGCWEGETYETIDRQTAGELWRSPARIVPPGGESFAVLIDRVGAAIDRLGERHRGRSLVIVAHAGSIRAALAHALDLTPEKALGIAVDPLSMTRLDRFASTNGEAAAWLVNFVNRSAIGEGGRQG